MMYKNYRKPTISKLVVGVCAALSTQTVLANDLVSHKVNDINSLVKEESQLNFSNWLATENEKQKNALPDRIIVKYKNMGSLTGSENQNTNAANKNATMQFATMASELSNKTGTKMSHVREISAGVHVFNVNKSGKNRSLNAILKVIQADSHVAYAEPDAKRRLLAQTQPWGISKVQADIVSDDNASNMTVCIIDSGYERANPDLNANNASGTNDSGTGNWYQNGGSHGTHVAGTIAGVNNSEGVVGVLPNTHVNLHIIKVFNDSGWGYSSDLVTAVNHCVNNGAKVVNMSLGGASSNTTERNGMQAAVDAGVLLIAASGNDGDSTLSYPASYDAVMAVGALDENNQHAEFSQYTAQVEVSAPGEAILSTVAGDGRLGTISVDGTTYSNDRGVVPQTHYIKSGTSFVVSNVDATVTANLGSCAISGSSYSCSNVSGNICVAERNDNQKGSNYPEINPAKACMDAGAVGVIVYSNSDRPGLQNPFLVDETSAVTVPAVSVNRTLGQELLTKLGQQTTLTTVGNQDYAYYNGTSMATPHAAAVAALAWSNNISCTGEQVRAALKATAIDLNTVGRDDKTGYGLVQTKAASDHLGNNCDGSTGGGSGGTSDNELFNGVAKTGLSGTKDGSISFTMTVPAGATDLAFNMSGGAGDADMYVKFGSVATSSNWDCRPYKGGNSESCPISTAQAGTYHVTLIGYTAFSGVSLTGSYTEAPTGGAQGSTSEVKDLNTTKNKWLYYTLEVPAGMATLDFTLANGSGDADLYIRQASQPTTSSYDCRSWNSGNTEACNFTNPEAGTYYIGINAYSTFSGVTLSTSYQP